MKEKIIELVMDGITYKEISKLLGCSLSTISYHCKKLNIKSRNTMEKMDDEKKDLINRLYSSGLSSLKISSMLGISKTTVLKYIKNLRKTKMTEDEVRISKVVRVVYWRKKVKAKLVDSKGGCCERCGYNKCIDALEFHHRNPNEKDFTISGKSWSFQKLKEETDKCILVCSNCHKEIHYEIRESSVAQW